MAGHEGGAVQKIMLGLKALQSSLDGVQIGSEIHSAILDAIQKIGKHLPQGGMGGDPNAQIQELAGMARGVRGNPQMAALQGMGGGAPPPGAGAPPPPSPAGGM